MTNLHFSGGGKHEFGDLYYQPTILTGMTKNMECYKDEIFGPVLAIMKFDTEEVCTKVNGCNSVLSITLLNLHLHKLH
jgi:acyl-CoA reductase-like NAD-dependent aldehyde dehydrogenase